MVVHCLRLSHQKLHFLSIYSTMEKYIHLLLDHCETNSGNTTGLGMAVYLLFS